MDKYISKYQQRYDPYSCATIKEITYYFKSVRKRDTGRQLSERLMEGQIETAKQTQLGQIERHLDGKKQRHRERQ